ncbi:MAG TPA: sulfatase [Thermoleophilaceae bacterium]|nr:sulfatase [Thermoleophilaceae bacterium]
MSRKLPLVLVTLFAAAALAAPAASAQPNVVVIMTDDQTAASVPTMPQLNSLLGGQGTRFEQAFASFPLCCPARATNLTGQYAHNHGVLHNSGTFGGFKALDSTNTLPVWLQAAGYRTMHVGRYLNGYEYRDGIPAGYTDWYGSPHSGAFNYSSWKVNENGVLRSYPSADRPGEYQTDQSTRRAVGLIEDAAPSAQPFYLSLWYVAPHRGRPVDPDDPESPGTPSPAPRHRNAFAGYSMPRLPSFNEKNMYDKPQVVADRRRFTPTKIAGIEENWRQELETLRAVDDGVAGIVDALQRTGELENTLIVYLSDNGYMHGEHRALAEKVLPYEESIRIPLLMRGPGIPRGRVDRRLVGNLDVPATILDAAGVSPWRVLDGRSLLELLADPGEEWGRDILIENGNGANGVPAYHGIRTYRFLYVEHRTTGEYELYDLFEDPFQLKSRDGNDRYRRVQRELRQRLRKLDRCSGAACSPAPGLRLYVRAKGRPVGSCVRSDLRVKVGGSEREDVLSADFIVGRKRVGRVLEAPAVKDIPRARLRRSGSFRLRVRAETADGRRLTLDRRLRVCS